MTVKYSIAGENIQVLSKSYLHDQILECYEFF